MKNVMFLFFAFVIGSLAFTSCSKDDNPTPKDNIDNEAYHFTCKIDNQTYHAEGILAYGADFTNSVNVYGLTDLEGSNAIYVALPKNLKEGTYTFNDEVYGIMAMGDKSYSTLLEGGEGTVTVSSFDGVNIQGTFSFTAIDFDDYETTTVVTDGTFNVAIR